MDRVVTWTWGSSIAACFQGEKNPEMIKTLLLSTGSVDNSSLPFTIATHKKGFRTFKRAMENLGKCFLQAYQDDERNRVKVCCKKHLNTLFNFCPICGYPISELRGAGPYELWCYIVHFLGSTSNEVGPYLDIFEDSGWSLWLEGNPFKDPKGVVVVLQSAGWWIVWALGLEPQCLLCNKGVRRLDGRLVVTGYKEEKC